MAEQETDWWGKIGEMRWQHVVFTLVALGAFIGLFFVPMKCSLSIDSKPTTTITTVAR